MAINADAPGDGRALSFESLDDPFGGYPNQWDGTDKKVNSVKLGNCEMRLLCSDRRGRQKPSQSADCECRSNPY
jgi:hypothetical protein